jgi:endonuclease G
MMNFFTKTRIVAIAFLLLLTACQTVTEPDSKSVHLKYGNPSHANSQDLNNYLIERKQYALSYNCSQGTLNWASWQLNLDWFGSSDRQNNFRLDPDLPTNCYAARPADYNKTGYDKGHMVPSADRSKTPDDNSATFLMTNILPQTPENNREVWRELEEYSRELVKSGRELYLVAGGYGNKETLANGKIVVPKYTWKVILSIDKPNNKKTAIAVMVPNSAKIGNTSWQEYQVPVADLEKLTGYRFFAKVR